jgi:hypothetical protein
MQPVLVHRLRFMSYDHLFVYIYIREYMKRKELEDDNWNNVPKRTKLHAELRREYRETHKNLSAEL